MAATTDGDVEGRVGHGALDAPEVDVLANEGGFVDGAGYSAITGYQDAPAGQVTLDVTPDTGDRFGDLVNVSTTETVDLAGDTISTNSGSRS
jgi:hypothetical protein